DEIDKLRRFGNWDPGWIACETTYLKYWAETGGHIIYRDWTKEGNGRQDYSVIPYRLPNDAKVAILGDWGTGMNDAKALLTEVMVEHHPTAILHLGDVYYSGTPEECTRHVAGICDQVFQTYGRVPVFTIPGNHDFYGLAKGRLVGASAYESTHDDDPYLVNFKEVSPQLFDGKPARAGMTDDFYNHSYAIVDFTRASPEDPIQVSYYQIPSWAGDE